MINQILLKNFKCFESLDLELKPLNVLMGLNGMGKSTLLQSLLLLRQSYQENRLSALKLNGKYIKLGNGSDILYERAEEEKISLNVNTGSPMKKSLLTETLEIPANMPFII